MPLTRRYFLKVSSAGFLSVAGFPITSNIVQLPSTSDASDFEWYLRPRIILIGVGGAGGSILSALMKHRLPGAIHMSVDTDERALKYHDADLKILIGQRATHGLWVKS